MDENTKTQAILLHDDIPGYDLPTIDFDYITEDNFEIKLIARLLDQIYVVQPPMFSLRYE